MNPRTVFMRYMGWCPGFSAAARFVPDRDLPSRKIASFALLTAAFILSTYFIVDRALIYVGFPSSNTVSIDYHRPKLIVVGKELYMASQLDMGYEEFGRAVIFLARLTYDGQVLKASEILDIGGSYLSTYDMIRTTRGEWFIVYQEYTLGFSKDLNIIHSLDGVNWEEPSIVARSSVTVFDANLIEDKNGDLLLFYTKYEGPATSFGEGYVVYLVQYSTQTGWGPPVKTTFKWYRLSSFLISDGNVSLVGVKTFDSPFVGGTYKSFIMKLLGDGTWSEPVDMNYDGNSWVSILYSRDRNGYFVLGYGSLGDEYIQVCLSKDLKKIEPLITFSFARNPSLVEFPNGTLVMVYEKVNNPFPYDRYWTELYITTSTDGLNWTNPHIIDAFGDESSLSMVLSGRRFFASTLISLLLSIPLVLLIYRRYARVLL